MASIPSSLGIVVVERFCHLHVWSDGGNPYLSLPRLPKCNQVHRLPVLHRPFRYQVDPCPNNYSSSLIIVEAPPYVSTGSGPGRNCPDLSYKHLDRAIFVRDVIFTYDTSMLFSGQVEWKVGKCLVVVALRGERSLCQRQTTNSPIDLNKKPLNFLAGYRGYAYVDACSSYDELC